VHIYKTGIESYFLTVSEIPKNFCRTLECANCWLSGLFHLDVWATFPANFVKFWDGWAENF